MKTTKQQGNSVNAPYVKRAAIWARVSTSGQAETSLPSQVSRCKDALSKAGYAAAHIFSIDFSSLDLYNCPEFQELRNLVRKKDIQALAVYDRDRLLARGLQRLIFLAELKEKGIELIICQGPPIMDGPEGQIVELALAVGKERQVLRARQGARDGLHDRATLKRLPTTYHKVFGYSWDKTSIKLVPDSNHDTVKLIFNLVLSGASFDRVLKELKERGIHSPSGQPVWNKNAISNITHNPLYAGRYYALKGFVLPPKCRKSINTYGNSSKKKKPLNESLYLPEVQVINPPITWNQREQILAQIKQHQKWSNRNAKRDYLLLGMIMCETHLGKNGEPRRYHGTPKRDTWAYNCSVGGCKHPYFNGPWLENWVKDQIRLLFAMEDKESLGNIFGIHNSQKSLTRLNEELDQLVKKEAKGATVEADLEYRNLMGELSKESFKQVKDRLKSERSWREERIEAINCDLASLARVEEAKASLEEIKATYCQRLDEMEPAEWRKLLVQLHVTVTVLENPSPGEQPSNHDGGTLIYVVKADSDSSLLTLGHDNRRLSGEVGGWLELGVCLPLNSDDRQEDQDKCGTALGFPG